MFNRGCSDCDKVATVCRLVSSAFQQMKEPTFPCLLVYSATLYHMHGLYSTKWDGTWLKFWLLGGETAGRLQLYDVTEVNHDKRKKVSRH
jgi:hypothetical protein